MTAASPVSDGDEPLEDLFWAVVRQVRHWTREAVAPFGITPAQSRTLGVLARHGALRLSALSEHLGIAPRSGTEVVDGLEERGLVERSPDPADRRATLVRLTPEGETVVAAVRDARRKATDTAFGTLSPADRETLARLLRQLRDAGT